MNNIKFRGPGTGRTCYIVIRGSGQSIWSTSGGVGGFESFMSGNWPEYAISAVEQGVSNIYIATVPTAMPLGVFDPDARQQLGGTAAQTDLGLGGGFLEWNGSRIPPLGATVTSGQFAQAFPMVGARGRMLQNFLFDMVSAVDHLTPFTSGQISGMITRGSGLFGPLESGAFTEVGNGVYRLQAFTSGDLNADTAFVIFNGVNLSGGAADPRKFNFVLQRSG